MVVDEKKWYEYLDWDEMQTTWNKLPEEIKDKIRKAGKAPKYDIYSR